MHQTTLLAKLRLTILGLAAIFSTGHGPQHYIDGGASKEYCPNCTKFVNYRSVQRDITTADKRTLTTVGIGDFTP